MAEAKGMDPGVRRLIGLLLLPLCFFLAMAVFSYDWRDISYLTVPVNDPTANLIGPVGAWLAFFLFVLTGVNAFLLPVGLFALALVLMFHQGKRVWPRVLWGCLVFLGLMILSNLHERAWAVTSARLNLSDTGGLLGRWLTMDLLVRFLNPLGTALIGWSLVLTGLVFFIGLRTLADWFCGLGRGILRVWAMLYTRFHKELDRRAKLQQEQQEVERRRRKLEKETQRRERLTAPASAAAKEAPPALAEERKPALKVRPAVTPPPKPPAPATAPAVPPPAEPPGVAYDLPAVELLTAPPKTRKAAMSVADTNETARVLQDTLKEFGIDAEVTNVEVGPVVTRYEVLPAPGIRVERISGLANNIALSLKATSIRVQAPIPGKGVVGIEVPNSSSNIVYLRELLEGPVWSTGHRHLPLALGKDVAGKDLVADLAEMPHLLIAGATGSGKTVCMNSILAGLLMSRRPDEMKLMLVDPKIVEFSAYNNLPHLVVPVITDPKKVSLGLRWAINEMEKRYKLFAKVGVRNIAGYNSREVVKQVDLFDGEVRSEDEPPVKVPYIVIVIDELADLMLAAQAEIENSIARLAQLSRAVGIHMIIATQRPSVNVITGTIKANFPARIAFQVAQRVDSRTILDTVGADKLLGRGDMLFLPPGSSKLIRAQGAMTKDEEIHSIVEQIKAQMQPSFETEIKEKLEKTTVASMDDGGEDDELLAQAVEIIRETRRASTSSLQRRLRIGYTRAARVMDILEERGLIGPPRGSDPREILIDLDGEIPENQLDDDEA